MEIIFLQNGRTEDVYLQSGIKNFEERLKHYVRYQNVVIPALKNTKNMPIAQQKEKEADLMLPYIDKADFVVLLDENGEAFRSTEFAKFVQTQMNKGIRKLLFIVGGPYGFSPLIHAKADHKLSLSAMTFSHQMIRLLFTEQIYRAFTILKNEAYHNE